jgi:hypothetical protein
VDFAAVVVVGQAGGVGELALEAVFTFSKRDVMFTEANASPRPGSAGRTGLRDSVLTHF